MDVIPTTVVSDQYDAFQKMQTRRTYLERFIPNWRGQYQTRLYAFVCLMLGVFFFSNYPAISVLAFAGAAYFYQRWKFHAWLITRPRTLYSADLR
ncbi:hypothetical protein HY991_05650 [Candidatus Micrarchaeota archaeon]|nr:hypothetical protein [Candidatus Micrarchaeota archaeon]